MITDKELIYRFNQIRLYLGDMRKPKIMYKIFYMAINLTKVSEAYLEPN